MIERILFHPILNHKKSRRIWLSYLVFCIAVAAYFWWRISIEVSNAGVYVPEALSELKPYQAIFLSSYFRWGFVVLVSLIGAAITAPYVAGPFGRMEKWLSSAKQGKSVTEFKVRANDKFLKTSKLVNQVVTQSNLN